jgi:hypothetical protein
MKTKRPTMRRKTAKAKTQVVVRNPRIYEKKLPPKIMGESLPCEFKVWIDPRQDSYEYLDTLIHEITHCVLPDLSEANIRKLSRIYSRAIWKKGYRRLRF